MDPNIIIFPDWDSLGRSQFVNYPQLLSSEGISVWVGDGPAPWTIPSIEALRTAAVSSVTQEQYRRVDAAVYGGNVEFEAAIRAHIRRTAEAVSILDAAVQAGGINNLPQQYRDRLTALRQSVNAVSTIDAHAAAIISYIGACTNRDELQSVIDNPAAPPAGWPTWGS